MINQSKTIFPGLSIMTVEEVRVMAKVCQVEGDNPEEISEIINCVDDCLSILKSASVINRIHHQPCAWKAGMEPIRGQRHCRTASITTKLKMTCHGNERPENNIRLPSD